LLPFDAQVLPPDSDLPAPPHVQAVALSAALAVEELFMALAMSVEL
jgi:hypothetical protein